MKRAARTGIAALLSVGAWSSQAQAYSDPERFEAPADEGGGGGRFFTGSPLDGYTCAVCHVGGAEPAVSVRGLPQAGYGPGQLFEVELIFALDGRSHALALEITDAAGQDLELELPAEAETAPAERCGAAADGKRAAYLSRVGTRRILGVEACEARAVRFRFRTGESPHVLVAATLLASDSSATVAGDGVTEITQPLYRDGRTARAAESGCSALSGRAGGSPPFLLGLWLAAALGRRRRRATGRGAPSGR